MIEVWKDIKGFEGKYQISNKGNIKSLKYNNTNQSKIMQPQINKKGYRRINLWKNNKPHQYLVGTLVAEHFLKKEHPDLVPVHIKDKLDDSIENLMFVTKSEARHQSHKKENQNIRIMYNFNSKEYRQFIKIANKNGITAHQMYKRLYEGWTIEEAITIPIKRKERILKKKMYDYYGKPKSISQLSEKCNIKTSVIYKRLSRGWNIYESVEIPVEIRKKKVK